MSNVAMQCVRTAPVEPIIPGSTAAPRATSRRRSSKVGLVAVALLVGAPHAARADFNPVPEIDPGSMASVVALMTGGVLALTDHRRRNRS